jgi:hypothetical protein
MLNQDRVLVHQIRHQGSVRPMLIKSSVIVFILSCLFACAPSLYSVNLKYESSTTVIPAAGPGQKLITTVALFNDTRPGGEDLQIGKVTTDMGGLSTIIPKNLKPAAAVSVIVKDILVKSGYQVSVVMPGWNLHEDAIQNEWGRILVGGNIEALEITCQNDIPIKTYHARAKLSFVFADVQNGKIFYQVTTESTNTLEHIYFSEEMLAQQISITLSEAAEKAFEGNSLKEKIREVLKQTP